MMLVTRKPLLSSSKTGFEPYSKSTDEFSDNLGDKKLSTRSCDAIDQAEYCGFSSQQPIFGLSSQPYNLENYLGSLYPQDNQDLNSDIAYKPFGDNVDPGYDSERSEEGGKTFELSSSYDLDSTDDEFEQDSGSRNSIADSLAGGLRLDVDYLKKIFPFINDGTLFNVSLTKNSRGLGISVSGGVECDTCTLPGLIRVTKIYPQTPAWISGELRTNDFILEVNGIQLTGLTSAEALEVLRTCPLQAELTVCRVTNDHIRDLGMTLENDPNEGRVVISSLTDVADLPISNYLSPTSSMSLCGEFEIHLTKVAGSLGFTLKKNDNSILGHTIRSLVKDPAVSDGRIRPGDKLLSVNGKDMCGMSHEEAVKYLRTCPDQVVIRIYRDAVQTPISPASPTETEFCRPKCLRQEARDMLSDLANQKRRVPCHDGGSDTLNRRRRLKNSSPDIKKANCWEKLVQEAESSSETQSSFDNDVLDSFSCSSSTKQSKYTYEYNQTHAPLVDNPNEYYTNHQRPERPTFLDLSSTSLKKSSIDIRTSSLSPPELVSSSSSTCEPNVTFPPDHLEMMDNTMSPSSMDNTMLPSSHSAMFCDLSNEHHSMNDTYLYQEGHKRDHCSSSVSATWSDNDLQSTLSTSSRIAENQSGLLKWKGINFIPNNGDTSSDSDDDNDAKYQVISFSLSRGWSCRLGFSLGQRGEDIVVSAVHEDSIAARDGRVQEGDIISEVNDDSLNGCAVEDVIEKLRMTRGKIRLKVKRNIDRSFRLQHFQSPHSDKDT